MAEKLLRQFEFSWQAQMAIEELESININFRIESRPRQYSSILLGGANDSSSIFVDESDYIRAADCLEKLQARQAGDLNNSQLNEAGEMIDGEKVGRRTGSITESNKILEVKEKPVINYFKRVIIFSIMGVLILPLIFNFVAFLNFLKLRKESTSGFLKIFALLFMLVFWVFSILILSHLINNH